jgi:hypothetical protein
MSARILRFPLAPQEPIRMAIPASDYPRGMTRVLLVAMMLSSGTVAGVGLAAWRFFHG